MQKVPIAPAASRSSFTWTKGVPQKSERVHTELAVVSKKGKPWYANVKGAVETVVSRTDKANCAGTGGW